MPFDSEKSYNILNDGVIVLDHDWISLASVPTRMSKKDVDNVAPLLLPCEIAIACKELGR